MMWIIYILGGIVLIELGVFLFCLHANIDLGQGFSGAVSDFISFNKTIFMFLFAIGIILFGVFLIYSGIEVWLAIK